MQFVIAALDLIDSFISFGEDSTINAFQYIEEILRFTTELEFPMLSLPINYRQKLYDQFISTVEKKGGNLNVLDLCQELAAETFEIDQNPDLALSFVSVFIVFLEKRQNKTSKGILLSTGIKKKLKKLLISS